MRVFVLGAGVSRSYGGSLAKDLLKDAISQSKARGKHIRMIRGIDKLLSYAFPEFDQHRGKYPPIEEVLSLLDTWVDFNSKIQGNPIFSDFQINEVRRWIIRIVADNLNMISSSKNIEATSPISKFALNLKPKDVVITFNWDLGLERAMDKYGKAMDKHGKDIDLDWSYRYPAKGSDIVLLKAHGSIDWYETSDIYSVPKGDKEPLDPNVGHISLIRWWEPKSIGRTKEIAPYIIPPTYFKTFQTEEIRHIWNDMYLTLSQAKKIIIIGYSLPSLDLQARVILRSSIEQNRYQSKAGKKGIVWGINPSQKANNTYQKLGLNFEFILQSFEDIDYAQLPY